MIVSDQEAKAVQEIAKTADKALEVAGVHPGPYASADVGGRLGSANVGQE